MINQAWIRLQNHFIPFNLLQIHFATFSWSIFQDKELFGAEKATINLLQLSQNSYFHLY